jgi:hypothetical protein
LRGFFLGALGIAMVASGALPVYLMAVCLDKKKRL